MNKSQQDFRITSFMYGISILFCAFAASIAGADETLPDEIQCKTQQEPSPRLRGWCVAISQSKGNCLACHVVSTKRTWPETLLPGGDIAPPLVEMRARFPDKRVLRARIWDATKDNPQTSMPPYGRHKLLSEEEIDVVVEWLLTI